MATSSSSTRPTTVEEISRDYSGRRAGLIRALTVDVENFYKQCRPGEEDLCLFGYPNESWEASVPCENVPPDIPEPCIGINRARDTMKKRDWILLVAVHSDSWLIAVAFNYAIKAGLSKIERGRLFDLINNMPTVFEVVCNWRPAKKPRKDNSNEASGSQPRRSKKRSSAGRSKSTENVVEEGHVAKEKSTENVVEEGHVATEEDNGQARCGYCMVNYSGDFFWIACDVCELWYHGLCVGVTPTMAESIGLYECPFCKTKRNKRESRKQTGVSL